MTSNQVSQVRIVRCPKCSRILAESADVPVYKCGGCGTVLQAHRLYRRSMTRKRFSKVRLNKCSKCSRCFAKLADVPEYKCGGCGTVLQDIILPKELENETQDKGSISTSHNLNLLPMDCNNRNSENESREDKIEVSNFPTDTSLSAELTFHENVDSSSIPAPPVLEQIDQSQTIDVLGHDSVRSTDTFKTELINSSSDLSDVLECLCL